MAEIQYLVMDVDGTLTDGKIQMGEDGEIAKSFNVKDGCGIKLLLPQYGITPIILTARKSRILENRCRELDISEIYQGVKDKVSKLKEIVGNKLDSVAYIGDDLPDLFGMQEVRKAGGIVMAPSDAISEIKAISDYTSSVKAGEGAVRDCINFLIQKNKKVDDLEIRIRTIVDWIVNGDYKDGYFPDGTSYVIQEYTTRQKGECPIEIHRNHTDIQYIIEGHEEFMIYSASCLSGSAGYDSVRDVELFEDGFITARNILIPGSLIVVYNGQPHQGAVIRNESETIKKLVCKIPVNGYSSK